MSNWPQYINLTKNKPPRELLTRALDFLKNKGIALDLGAGALNDSKYLLNFGFKQIIAIDSEKNNELVAEIDSSVFVFKKMRIEDYDFPEKYFDLINAQFVLPFIDGDKMKETMSGIKNSLKSGGIFVGQFFGEKDEWRGRPGIRVYNEKQVKDFLSGLEIIYFKEEEKTGPSAMNGQKHWHLFHFIVRKI